MTETTATVFGLLPTTAYSFKVSAVYPQELQRDEGMSEAVSATTGPAFAPTGLAASVVGRGLVHLSWDKLPEADGFRLFRNGALVSDIKRSPVDPALATSFDDSVPVGTHLYQIQAVYIVAYGVDKGAEAVSAPAPTPAVSVTIQPSTKVRYCQTRAGVAKCADPGASSVTIAASTLGLAEGRKSP